MRSSLAVLLLCGASILSTGSGDRTSHDPDARRASDDLARYYANPDSFPPIQDALDALTSPSADRRRSAGRYLGWLLQLSLNDETNGRARWVQTPYFGGGMESPARRFREEFAEAFGDEARGENAVPALEWLLFNEPDPGIQAHGVSALSRMHGPATTKLVRRLLDEPHPNKAVLLAAIRAADAQSVLQLQRVSLDPRESVRKAAGDALVAFKTVPPPYRPTAAFPSWLATELRATSARVWTKIPSGAPWKLFIVDTGLERQPELRVSGWLLAEEDTAYLMLDEFAREGRLSRRHTRILDQTLAEEAARVAGIGGSDSLSSRGGLTAQFEPRGLHLPQILLAAWSLERGDTASAAALLYPRLDALEDNRQFAAIARDLLGNGYHLRMLEAFSYDRDYAKTLALAIHLSKPLFDGYDYQPRARELAAQLPLRQDDFHAFALPDSLEWFRRARTLDRAAQVAYLAERLRLLNCFQWGQPGGVDVHWDQYEEPTHMTSPWDTTTNRSRRLVNPYAQLEAMHLTPADVRTLAPALADVRYAPTFGFWRDFHPERDLYRVCDLAAWLINDVAQERLVDPDSIPGLPPDRRSAMVRRVEAWSAANTDLSSDEMNMKVLETTRVGYEFRLALEKGLARKDPRVAPIVLARTHEFPNELDWILKLCAGANDPAFVPLARKLLHEPLDPSESDYGARMRVFFSGLILLRQGDTEGLDAVRTIVEGDTDGWWTREALEPLIARKDSATRSVLCGVGRKPRVLFDPANGAMLRQLFHAGCDELGDSLVAKLRSEKSRGTAYSSDPKTGNPIERNQVEGDAVAEYVVYWKPGGQLYDKLEPDAERKHRREELADWLAEQTRLQRKGEATEIRPLSE